MAGGKGTRLRPDTESCPKPMLEIDGKPILEIILDNCISNGFRYFYISVNYLKEQIIDYFSDGTRWGVSIKYLVEDKPLGTAGSLQLLPDSITEPILVLNGDILTRFNPRDLIDFHIRNGAQATLCAREVSFTIPFGIVQTDGTYLTTFSEKPTFQYLVNVGVYSIDPRILKLLRPNYYTDMPTLLDSARKRNYRVAVCPIHDYWIDIGSHKSLRLADSFRYP